MACGTSSIWREHDHHLVRVVTAPQEIGHQVHRPVDVLEEGQVAGAQVVEARFAVRRLDEPVARTLAVARELDRTLLAVDAAACRACRSRTCAARARQPSSAGACRGCCRAGTWARRSGRSCRRRRCAPRSGRCRTSRRRCTPTAARRPTTRARRRTSGRTPCPRRARSTRRRPGSGTRPSLQPRLSAR